MNNINQLLVQAQAAYDAADWSSLIQYLQTLILLEDLELSELPKYQEHLLELAIAVLESGDFQQRWEITKIFARLDKISVTPLIDILEDENTEEELRWFAARILGEMKNPEAIAPLVELLKSTENEELQESAATALGQIGTIAIAALTELLTEAGTSENNYVSVEERRLLAVKVLSHIRQPETIPLLLSVVQDSQVAVRAAAIEALSSFHDPRVPPVLVNALDDLAAPVRREAVRGLGFRPELSSEFDLVGKLKSRLYDFNLDVCCAAAIALSRMGCDRAAKDLFEVLVSPHTPSQLQLEAVRALSWVETVSSLEFLQQALHQLQTPGVWREIITVLGRISNVTLTNKATKILLQMLEENHPTIEVSSIKSAIALSLGQLGNMQAISKLTELSTDKDPQVRLHAMAALKRLAPEEAL
ncbi:MAG: HEAT repeat domain-containing protein [Scytonema sp. PMC 1069.18]|nr:HEAT repeat domain-containing protein [Scytonema sp. PMC 1069.18]MEC4885889.1 HEAT repeat domain-containing protein [Scytonema sp. PMC 1070.18]